MNVIHKYYMINLGYSYFYVHIYALYNYTIIIYIFAAMTMQSVKASKTADCHCLIATHLRMYHVSSTYLLHIHVYVCMYVYHTCSPSS